jgi:hypothetical protein
MTYVILGIALLVLVSSIVTLRGSLRSIKRVKAAHDEAGECLDNAKAKLENAGKLLEQAQEGLVESGRLLRLAREGFTKSDEMWASVDARAARLQRKLGFHEDADAGDAAMRAFDDVKKDEPS